jgi:O-antigen/teichoic acid export membrane protein
MYLLLRSDIFIINYFLGSVAAGLYSVAILFSELFQKIPNTLGPLVISRTVNDDSIQNIYNVVRLVRFTFFINLILILILSVFGEGLIILLFKSEFAYAFEALLYLLPAFIFLGPGGIIYSYFIGRAFPLKPIIISGIAATFSILLNIHFVPKYGIKASAAIGSIVYVLWSLSLLIYFKTKNNVTLSDLIFIKKNDVNYIFSHFSSIFKKSNT